LTETQIFQMVCLLLLLIISAFFSASETAMFSVNKVKIRHLAEEGDKKAIQTKHLLEQPGRLISTILIGNNVVNIGATALATTLAISIFGSKGVGIATGMMSFLVLVFGEITPKTLASRNAENFSLKISGYIDSLGFILSPIIHILNLFTNVLVKLLGGSKKENSSITEEELRMLVNVGEKEGLIDHSERDMIDSIFEFDDIYVHEIMTPMLDIIAINAGDSLENLIKLIMKVGHSRIPVYDQSLDNIIGVIYAKDTLSMLLEPPTKKVLLKEVMRSAYFVPESKKVHDLFAELRKEKVHMAIVLDEYGGTAGLVTIEDVIEEIVGDIQDEYDHEELAIEVLADGSFLVNARTPISEISDLLGIDLSEDEFETISGLVFHNLGRFPYEGQEIDFNGIHVVIEKIIGRRIGKLRIRKNE